MAILLPVLYESLRSRTFPQCELQHFIKEETHIDGTHFRQLKFPHQQFDRIIKRHPCQTPEIKVNSCLNQYLC